MILYNDKVIEFIKDWVKDPAVIIFVIEFSKKRLKIWLEGLKNSFMAEIQAYIDQKITEHEIVVVDGQKKLEKRIKELEERGLENEG